MEPGDDIVEPLPRHSFHCCRCAQFPCLVGLHCALQKRLARRIILLRPLVRQAFTVASKEGLSQLHHRHVRLALAGKGHQAVGHGDFVRRNIVPVQDDGAPIVLRSEVVR